MICPYCEKEMQRGWVNQERMGLQWEPDDGRGFLESLFDPRMIQLSSITQSGRVIMYHCTECRKFIIDENDIEV